MLRTLGRREVTTESRPVTKGRRLPRRFDEPARPPLEVTPVMIERIDYVIERKVSVESEVPMRHLPR